MMAEQAGDFSGLTQNDLIILRQLSADAGAGLPFSGISALSRKSGIRRASINGSLARLERKGLISWRQGAERVSALEIVPTGQRLPVPPPRAGSASQFYARSLAKKRAAAAAQSPQPKCADSFGAVSGRTLLDASERDGCLYPYGDGREHSFCGYPRDRRGSYCPRHKKICAIPADLEKVRFTKE